MEKGVPIANLFGDEQKWLGKTVIVQGWVKTRRDSKAGVCFIEVNDGSTLKGLQVLAEEDKNYAGLLAKVTTGSAILAEGVVSASPGKGQRIELRAERIHLYGSADPATYPLQKKRHSFEYLRQIAHLRPRTNTLGAAARVRSRLSFAIHQFFQLRGFHYIHTPIITASDCEGAGEIFRVTTLDPTRPLAGGVSEDPYRGDFFARPAFLTVSGQLQAEIFALALGKVYTFGPTFRAENSNTSRHLAEFWMVEPEMAFHDLGDDLEVALAFIRHLVEVVLNECEEDVEFFGRFIDSELPARLQNAAKSSFEVITYTDAVDILKRSREGFVYPVEWGIDLQAEHERYLTEKVFGGPAAIIDFPRALKPFYMRVNDDEKTVAAMDILVPGTGEIIGGSQREERLEMLLEQMRLKGIPADDYRWYIELREFGSAPHSGFGLGLERLVQFVTGIPNIREVIAFPRTPGHAEF